MQYQLAIFDLDGTILDTLEDLYLAVNYALRECSLPERSREEVRQFLGNGMLHLIQCSVPQGSDEALVSRTAALFNAFYAKHCTDHTKPYEGIPALVAELRAAGMQTAVVSNKPDYGVQQLIADHFPSLFDCAAGEREGVRRKPAPDAVNAVLTALSVPRECAVYIGDSEVDIETAKQAGMPCISVDWGFRSAQFLTEAGAQRIVSSTEELKQLLLTT
ncbi:MAG: HAD family hydrolase [Oscillospiraceae bacterium]|nr:HAD family hydrolase [Oscillospiraceae bacterium]